MRNTSKILWPALALAVSAFALPAQAQNSGTTSQEMQRGVPAVDVDTNTRNDRGVPGVDVDVGTRNNRGVPGTDVDIGTRRNDRGVPGVDVDTRTSGAGMDTSVERTARADRG